MNCVKYETTKQIGNRRSYHRSILWSKEDVSINTANSKNPRIPCVIAVAHVVGSWALLFKNLLKYSSERFTAYSCDIRKSPITAAGSNKNKDYFYRRRNNSTLVRVYRSVKATYRDKLDTMVHELVHYRFRYLSHGEKFEQMIQEIIRGKGFPAKQLY